MLIDVAYVNATDKLNHAHKKTAYLLR